MAKKQKKKRKWVTRIDNTRAVGKTGRLRQAYRWRVEYGKYSQSGTCFSYSEAQKEVAAAKHRITEAMRTRDKTKAHKPLGGKRTFMT